MFVAKSLSLILIFFYSLTSYGVSLKFDAQELISKNEELVYLSPNLKFTAIVKPCSKKHISKYFKHFDVIQKTQLEKMKIKKVPVPYIYKGQKATTFQGSKIHQKLEKMTEDILLLKYKVERKC